MIPKEELMKISQLSDAIIDFERKPVLGTTFDAINLRGAFSENVKRNVFYFFKEFQEPLNYVLLSPTILKEEIIASRKSYET